MVPNQRHLLSVLSSSLICVCVAATVTVELPDLRPDDPLLREPPPRDVVAPLTRQIDAMYDFFDGSFVEPRLEERRDRAAPSPAKNVNSIDEVPDSEWFTNRHGRTPMSLDDLKKGAGNTRPPATESPWRVIKAKSDGVSPGFLIQDKKGDKYLVKFDPPNHQELASAADVIGSKIFYALGYNTPENYIVRFTRSQLVIEPGSSYSEGNEKRSLNEGVIDHLLALQPKDTSGQYRALASKIIGGKIVGPFRYTGTRTDDVNDLIPHQDRRELRGLAVFSAWINHTDAKSLNTLDSLVEENGRHFLRHYLIDWGSSLGSDSLLPKDPRSGHEYFIDTKNAGVQLLTLGLKVPDWSRAHFPDVPGGGNFEFEKFEPESWKPNYPNPAFLEMHRRDAEWAARQISRFSDADIRSLVETGEYSASSTNDWIVRCLIERRNRIVAAYLRGAAALDAFSIQQGTLRFRDAVAFGRASQWTITWRSVDAATNATSAIPASTGDHIPSPPAGANLLVATVTETGDAMSNRERIDVFLRRMGDSWAVAAVQRR